MFLLITWGVCPKKKIDHCSHTASYASDLIAIYDLQPNTKNDKDYYTIQINSFSSKKKASHYTQQFSNMNIPVHLHQYNEVVPPIFKIRIGKFLNESDAKLFATYWRWKKTRIIKEKIKPDDLLINQIAFEDFNIETSSFHAFVSSKLPLFIIYKKNYGIGMSIQPSELYLFVPGQNKGHKISDITGFIEKDQTIQFGKSILLYQNPNGLPKINFQSIFDEYSIKLKRSPKDIQTFCLEFNDGYDIRLTLLGEYNFITQKDKIYNELGFDYAKSGKLIQSKHSGQLFGNDQMVRINSEDMQSFQGHQITAYSQKGSLNQIKLCVLFFQKSK